MNTFRKNSLEESSVLSKAPLSFTCRGRILFSTVSTVSTVFLALLLLLLLVLGLVDAATEMLKNHSIASSHILIVETAFRLDFRKPRQPDNILLLRYI